MNKSALRRGFKSEANAHAVCLRRELNLDDHAPLCPWVLAAHLAIPIIPLSSLIVADAFPQKYLLNGGKKYFSAVTIFVGRYGRKRIVFHNDGHSKPRQAANLAHEISHAILCHSPAPPFLQDEKAEKEASWLGPALLISNEAALHIVESRMTAARAQSAYNVSAQLLTMRLNVSGANIRAQRRAKDK